MDEEAFLATDCWQSMRKAILKRDHYLCRDCKRYGRYRAAVLVHHIEHYDVRPDLALEPSNLISLCNACHNKRHPEKGANHKRY